VNPVEWGVTNSYCIEGRGFDSLFGWLRATQHCGCSKWHPTHRWLESTVEVRLELVKWEVFLELDWFGYIFRFNRNRIRIITMKQIAAMQKTVFVIIVASGKITIFRNHISHNLLFLFLSVKCKLTWHSGS